MDTRFQEAPGVHCRLTEPHVSRGGPFIPVFRLEPVAGLCRYATVRVEILLKF